jgi:hypothetical protein
MSPQPGQWDDLRLAAKAADRDKAAEQLRPVFQQRLAELGYGPRAIAHAFTTLPGAGTVDDALAELAHHQMLARLAPVALAFETVEHDPALPLGRSLTIDAVERGGDTHMRITYTVSPPLARRAGRPRVEARDDCDHEYGQLGDSLGVAVSKDRAATIGSFTLPPPHPRASSLRVRMSWSTARTSLWERPAHEVSITL